MLLGAPSIIAGALSILIKWQNCPWFFSYGSTWSVTSGSTWSVRGKIKILLIIQDI